jgi:hypothetical protein
MDEKLELQLVEKYPKILKDYKGDPMLTCLSWGFENGNGWYDLLDKCMEKMQYFCDLCSKDGREVQVVAAQIKSKFATLRFYVDIYDANELETSIIYGFIDDAERKSARTCEVCGKDGKLRASGWHTTLCEEHTNT